MLTDVLPRRVQGVEVVQVGEGAEELLRAAHLVPNNESSLAAALDLEDLNDGPVSRLDVPHDALVKLQSVLAGLLKEDSVRHRPDIRLVISAR